MLAALQFASELAGRKESNQIARLRVELYGSLALTGLGHRSDRAIVAGLSGEHPRSVDPEQLDVLWKQAAQQHQLRWLGQYAIRFEPARDLILNCETFLPQHPNGIRFQAFGSQAQVLFEQTYFSIGGGFVINADEFAAGQPTGEDSNRFPHPFRSADELLAICQAEQISIADVVDRNERVLRSPQEIEEGLNAIWQVMLECIQAGCAQSGILPGGLGIRRRAPEIYRKLQPKQAANEFAGTVSSDPLERMDWVTLFALAVNEQNAAGGRVVTAPTNGAAGVIPAVCLYYQRFTPGATTAGVHTFLKTAAAIGMLYKRNASLSAAEMGCQGEVGVACSMAAAGLAAAMGGTPSQIENAAEIGMEHNLGLTCDPVAGLVQVPCIERNTMGAVKAINAARLAVLYGDGKHRVSLDKVIETMRQTGLDMQSKYKETSLGGLAANITLC